MASDITVRPLHSLHDFRRCVELTREVWHDTDLETEPYVTFVIAHHTGGQVLGAFDGDLMVGFTKAFAGLRDHTPYLHSHMAAVLPAYRDRHIGRKLKLAQREDALRRGLRRIEWTFDPLETKNAHFNINRLGAIARTYIPNFYGITSSPLHRGLPTDRLLVEWHLDSPRAISAISNLSPSRTEYPVQVHLPANPNHANKNSPTHPRPLFVDAPLHSVAQDAAHQTATLALSPEQKHVISEPIRRSRASSGEGGSETRERGTEELIALQSHLRTELTNWFSKGYAILAVRFPPNGVDYSLAPFSDY
jgi:predicted GNAT superfamily acetyltransferase